jgi:hypothetical protein
MKSLINMHILLNLKLYRVYFYRYFIHNDGQGLHLNNARSL